MLFRGPWAAGALWCPCCPACLWTPELVALVLRTRQRLSGRTPRKEPPLPQLCTSGGHRPQAPGVWPAFRSPLEWSFSPTESASPECSAVPKHLVQLSPFMHEGVEPEPSAGPEGHPRDGSLTASSLATTPPASLLASKPLVLSPNVR